MDFEFFRGVGEITFSLIYCRKSTEIAFPKIEKSENLYFSCRKSKKKNLNTTLAMEPNSVLAYFVDEK